MFNKPYFLSETLVAQCNQKKLPYYLIFYIFAQFIKFYQQTLS